MYKRHIFFITVLILILSSSVLRAQPAHFIVQKTGICDAWQLMVIRGTAAMNGTPLSLHDEIGIFYNGILCGATDISDINGSYVLYVYSSGCINGGPGDPNDVLRFKLWDSSEGQEIDNNHLNLTINSSEIKNNQGELIWKINTSQGAWIVDIEYIRTFELADVSPKMGYMDEEISITLSGQNFWEGNTEVKIEKPGHSLTLSSSDGKVIVIDADTVTATIPAGELEEGTYNITLTIGISSKVLNDIFQIEEPLSPQINSIMTITTFENKATNDKEVMAIIQGNNFLAGAVARIGTTFLIINNITEHIIWVTIPKGISPGIYSVFVTNPPPYNRTGELSAGFEILQGIGKTVNLGKGLNLFAYPVDIENNYTSYNFLKDYFTTESLFCIQAYDTQTQSWKITYFDAEDNIDGDEFDMENGTGYLLYLKEEEEEGLFFPGTLSDFTLNLHPGLNIVSCNKEEEYDSYQLMQDLVDTGAKVASIQKLDKESGRYLVTFWLNDRQSGDNYSINKDESFLIYMIEEKLNYSL